MDEVSICPGGTEVAELMNGNINVYRLEAADFGLRGRANIPRIEIAIGIDHLPSRHRSLDGAKRNPGAAA